MSAKKGARAAADYLACYSDDGNCRRQGYKGPLPLQGQVEREGDKKYGGEETVTQAVETVADLRVDLPVHDLLAHKLPCDKGADD